MDSEVKNDSDASDGWSIVNFKIEDPTSEAPKEDGLDECYELTELTLSSAEPLGIANNTVLKPHEDSDDSISIISENGEVDVNHKKQGSDNSKNNLKQIDPSAKRLLESSGSDDASLPDSNDDGAYTTLITSKSSQVLMAEVVESEETPSEQASTLCCSINKYFLSVAVVIALVSIFFSNIFKSESEATKMEEILIALRTAEADNEVLKSHIRQLVGAYATLESKLNPQDYSLPKTEAKRMSSQENEIRQFILPIIVKNPYSNDPKTVALVSNLVDILTQIPEGYTNHEIDTIERQIENEVWKLLENNKNKVDLNKLAQRVNRIGNKLAIKLKALSEEKKKEDALNIVQWFPDENEESPVIEKVSEEKVEAIVPNNQKPKKRGENCRKVNNVPENDYKESRKNKKRVAGERQKTVESGCKNRKQGCGENKSGGWFFERAKDRERTRREDRRRNYESISGRLPLETMDRNYDQNSWYMRKMQESEKSRL